MLIILENITPSTLETHHPTYFIMTMTNDLAPNRRQAKMMTPLWLYRWLSARHAVIRGEWTRGNSIANALELLQSCANPSAWFESFYAIRIVLQLLNFGGEVWDSITHWFLCCWRVYFISPMMAKWMNAFTSCLASVMSWPIGIMIEWARQPGTVKHSAKYIDIRARPFMDICSGFIYCDRQTSCCTSDLVIL